MFNPSDSNPFFIHPCMDEGRAVDIVYSNFSKTFDTVSHTSSWVNSGTVEEWTVRRTENWLNSRSQRVAQGLTEGLLLAVSPKVQYWVQHC